MPSSYTTSGVVLIADSEESGTWGQVTNTNLQIIDRLASQAGSISLSGTTHTLNVSDGTLSDGHYGILVFGGTPSGTNTVTINPNDAQRIYMVKNDSGQSVIMSQGSGSTVTVSDGEGAIIYCDGAGSGAAVVDMTATFGFQTYDAGLAAIAGLAVTDGNMIVGNGSTWVAESGDTVLASLGVTATAAELNTMDGITASTASLNTASTHYVPSGGIIMWSGSVASIPSGWYLCDGTNGTPNLTGKFVVHADADTGGTYAPGDTGGADSVTLTSSEIPGHTHTFSGSTNTTGSHTHTEQHYQTNGSGNGPGPGASCCGGSTITSALSTLSAGDHSHTFSGTTSSTGGGGSHENRPPYYALAYIMKA